MWNTTLLEVKYQKQPISTALQSETCNHFNIQDFYADSSYCFYKCLISHTPWVWVKKSSHLKVFQISFSCLINMNHNRSYYMTLLCCKWDILSSAIGITTVRNWIQHVNTWHRDEVIDLIILTVKTCGAFCWV